MRHVPTSPTFASLNERKHELELAINVLKSAKEQASRDAALSADALSALRGDIQKLEESLSSLEAFCVSAVSDARDTLTEVTDSIREAGKLASEYVHLLASLDVMVKNLVTEADTARKSAEQSHESVLKESEELGRMRDDLDIYRKRLEVHYEKNMPGQNIHL